MDNFVTDKVEIWCNRDMVPQKFSVNTIEGAFENRECFKGNGNKKDSQTLSGNILEKLTVTRYIEEG